MSEITVPLATESGTCQTCSKSGLPLFHHQEKRLCASCAANTLPRGGVMTFQTAHELPTIPV